MKKYIAVDLGASNGRVVAGDLHGIEVFNRFVTRNEKVHGSVYWDILYIFSEIKKGLAKAFAEYGDDIVSIGIDTWGVDYGLLDGRGNLIGFPYHYRDDRTDGIMDEVFSTISADAMYDLTGIQFMQLNTVFQLAAMKKENPEMLAAAKHYLSIPDLLNYWLTGVIANEYSHATTTQLYSTEKGDWAWEIIDALGLPRKMFGEVVPSGTVLGALTEELQKELKAPEHIVVTAGACHDTAAAVMAVPSRPDEQFLYLSSGTWSLLGAVLEKPVINRKSRAYNFTNEGAADGGVRFLKNIMGMWIQQESIRYWESEGEKIAFKELDEETLACADFDAAIDPNDPRFLKPNANASPMPQRIREFCREHGMQIPEKKGEYMAAVYRGLAEAYAKYVSQLQEVTGETYTNLYIIGGGSKNTILNQWTADATGLTCWAGPIEATALGNILTQAIASGDIENTFAGREIIRTSQNIRKFSPSR